jgi:hypothetical protein
MRVYFSILENSFIKYLKQKTSRKYSQFTADKGRGGDHTSHLPPSLKKQEKLYFYLPSPFFSGDFERYVKRALEMEHLSVYRGSNSGTWRETSFLGTLKDM